MRIAAALLSVLAVVGSVIGAEPCPPPVVKIKGPCPSPCAPCPKLPTPSCPKCPDCICAPVPPCPACPPACPDVVCETDQPTVPPVPVAPALPPHGAWSLPISVGVLPSADLALAWTQRPKHYPAVDPSFDVSLDRRVFGGIGLAYTSSRRFTFAASLLYTGTADASAAWHERPAIETWPQIIDGEPAVAASGSHLGAIFSVAIPLGGGKP